MRATTIRKFCKKGRRRRRQRQRRRRSNKKFSLQLPSFCIIVSRWKKHFFEWEKKTHTQIEKQYFAFEFIFVYTCKHHFWCGFFIYSLGAAFVLFVASKIIFFDCVCMYVCGLAKNVFLKLTTTDDNLQAKNVSLFYFYFFFDIIWCFILIYKIYNLNWKNWTMY